MLNFTEEKGITYLCTFYGPKLKVLNDDLLNIFKTNRAIDLVFLCILFVVTILLNGISILTILKCPQLKSKVCYFLILIQSSIDLIIGMISVPGYTMFTIWHMAGNEECMEHQTLLHYLTYFPTSVSMFSCLYAMTYERYMGVVFPFEHCAKVTKKKLLKFQSCFWLLTFIVNVVAYQYSRAIYEIYGTIVVTLGFFFAAFAYIKIFITARKETPLQQRPVDNHGSDKTPSFDRRRRFLRELKLAKSCFLVVIAFAFSYSPAVILLTIPLDKQQAAYLVLDSWVFTVIMTNSSLNSFIYFWENQN